MENFNDIQNIWDRSKVDPSEKDKKIKEDMEARKELFIQNLDSFKSEKLSFTKNFWAIGAVCIVGIFIISCILVYNYEHYPTFATYFAYTLLSSVYIVLSSRIYYNHKSLNKSSKRFLRESREKYKHLRQLYKYWWLWALWYTFMVFGMIYNLIEPLNLISIVSIIILILSIFSFLTYKLHKKFYQQFLKNNEIFMDKTKQRLRSISESSKI